MAENRVYEAAKQLVSGGLRRFLYIICLFVVQKIKAWAQVGGFMGRFLWVGLVSALGVWRICALMWCKAPCFFTPLIDGN